MTIEISIWVVYVGFYVLWSIPIIIALFLLFFMVEVFYEKWNRYLTRFALATDYMFFVWYRKGKLRNRSSRSYARDWYRWNTCEECKYKKEYKNE